MRHEKAMGISASKNSKPVQSTSPRKRDNTAESFSEGPWRKRRQAPFKRNGRVKESKHGQDARCQQQPGGPLNRQSQQRRQFSLRQRQELCDLAAVDVVVECALRVVVTQERTAGCESAGNHGGPYQRRG